MMKTRIDRDGLDSMGRVVCLLSVCLLCLACATVSRPRAETPPRVKDSLPDKVAAQRAASGNLRLEEDDERWGIEAARANRKTDSDQPGQPTPTVSTPKGPVDLEDHPASSPAQP
jgi:hypothetical protein